MRWAERKPWPGSTRPLPARSNDPRRHAKTADRDADRLTFFGSARSALPSPARPPAVPPRRLCAYSLACASPPFDGRLKPSRDGPALRVPNTTEVPQPDRTRSLSGRTGVGCGVSAILGTGSPRTAADHPALPRWACLHKTCRSALTINPRHTECRSSPPPTTVETARLPL